MRLTPDQEHRFSEVLKKTMRSLRMTTKEVCEGALLSADSLKKIKQGAYCTTANAELLANFVATVSEADALKLRKASGILNGSPFCELWSGALRIESFTAVTGRSVERRLKKTVHASDDAGEGHLLNRLVGRLREEQVTESILHISSSTVNDLELVRDAVWRESMLFVGGSISNIHVQRHLNRLPTVRYIIQYDEPDFRNSRIHDRKDRSNKEADTDKASKLTKDYGILTIMRNPYPPMLAAEWGLPTTSPKVIIAVMGVHGSATHAVFRLLLEDKWIERLLADFGQYMPSSSSCGFQALYSCDPDARDPELVPGSLHVLEAL